MKALIVHLSDIHIQGEDDHVLNRARQISSAVRNLEYDLAACFIVVSGDTAYSDTDDQYWAAVDFMEELRGTLATDLRIRTEVRYVVVPGNHDCDFSGSTEVRDVLLDSIEKDPKLASNDEMIKTCTTTQDNYFAYLRLLDDESDDRRVYSRLYYDYQFEVGQKTVVFRCFNTAWISRLREKAGELLYPLDKIQKSGDEADVVVSVFHHPYNWLQPDNAREFRKHVESTSDIIK